MKGRLISVVVPVYNRASILNETFQSVRAQTYRPIELIIVDNGSTDASLFVSRDFADKYAAPDFRVIVIVEQKRGASAARNAGLRLASGEWISFFDSDDVMSRDFLSDMSRNVAESTDIVVTGTSVLQDGQLIPRVFVGSSRPEAQILASEISTQSFIAKRSFVSTIGGWDESVMRWNDWELGVRVLLSTPSIVWLRHKSYHLIRAHSQSITGSGFSESCRELLHAMQQAEADIRRLAHGEKRFLSALAMKAFLLSGTMLREKDAAASEQMLRYAETVRPNWFIRKLGYCLSFLTSRGVRGLWRVAYAVTRFI